MILAYIELSDGEYTGDGKTKHSSSKFHICDVSDNLNHFIKLEDYKINVIIIKINLPPIKHVKREAPIIQVKKVLKKR